VEDGRPKHRVGFAGEVSAGGVNWRAAMPPTLADGKICYLEIPATDVGRSADFYNKIFGWEIRKRGDGATAFDDAVGEVSGAFVVGRPPASVPGLMVYIWVENAAAVVKTIVANGGEIVQGIGGDPGEITARFRDPAGNVLGIYQEPG
jgi:predicted enzyme related to lactoylglutathione lyase